MIKPSSKNETISSSSWLEAETEINSILIYFYSKSIISEYYK
jgi:hypothetical protein